MRSRRERGAAMLEFAIIVPVLLMLVLGIVEFGYRYAKAAEFNNAAFLMARSISVGATPDISKLPAGGSIPASDPLPACTSATAGQDVRVVIDGTLDSPTGFFEATFGVHGVGVARCEG